VSLLRLLVVLARTPANGNHAVMLSTTRYGRHFQFRVDSSQYFGQADCAQVAATPAANFGCC